MVWVPLQSIDSLGDWQRIPPTNLFLLWAIACGVVRVDQAVLEIQDRKILLKAGFSAAQSIISRGFYAPS